jgi:hypothetical protein
MLATVIDFKSHRHLRCDDVPMSERCTDRLREGQCPGAQAGICCSSKLDKTKHNVELPKFFAAQH